jgi:hypothetical protein
MWYKDSLIYHGQQFFMNPTRCLPWAWWIKVMVGPSEGTPLVTSSRRRYLRLVGATCNTRVVSKHQVRLSASTARKPCPAQVPSLSAACSSSDGN